MKARIPSEWDRLSPAQKKRIEEHLLNVVKERMERDGRIMLDLYIKMVCVTLHDAFGFGEKRLNMFLGNHRRLFYEQAKMVKDKTQVDYLNSEMDKIFRKNGFPQGFFDKILGGIVTCEVV